MSFPRLGRVANPAKAANPVAPENPGNVANPANLANPPPEISHPSQFSHPADSAEERSKQASIRVRLLCPDHAEELLAFWHDDHDDLLALPDEAILALAQDYLRHRDYYRGTIESTDTVVEIDGARVTLARPVRCADCQRFERLPGHDHLGHCQAGEPEPIAGLWDTDRRSCRRFVAC